MSLFTEDGDNRRRAAIDEIAGGAWIVLPGATMVDAGGESVNKTQTHHGRYRCDNGEDPAFALRNRSRVRCRSHAITVKLPMEVHPKCIPSVICMSQWKAI
ncbi:hypothetical protein KM043_004525 [Ampulex compressa]|nr:hypothetical protein KM043_004525 [Ampulex compressa]